MRYSTIKTFYFIKSGHASHDDMVRYDIITISENEYLISALYGKSGEPAQVIEFNFTREEYEEKYGLKERMIHVDAPVTFEEALRMKCQEHRDSLE